MYKMKVNINLKYNNKVSNLLFKKLKNLKLTN